MKQIIKGIDVEDNPLLNDNVAVIGVSGSGKTTQYVSARLDDATSSFVCADTKSNLYKTYKDELENKGYRVELLDFINSDNSTIGYNPFDYIGKDAYKDEYSSTDISSLCSVLLPESIADESFWVLSARRALEGFIGLFMESEYVENKNLYELNLMISDPTLKAFYLMCEEISRNNMNYFAIKRFGAFMSYEKVERTFGCVKMFVDNAIRMYDTEPMKRMFEKAVKSIKFGELGETKTALFINISDTDRSLDILVSLFYQQLFDQLIKQADAMENGRLKIPVHIILDDFATNCCISDFDSIISVIRSRNISTSIILQSLSQIEGMYSYSKAITILNGCDRSILLGVNDYDTALYFAKKANAPVHSILDMPLDKAYLFERGKKARIINKTFDFSKDNTKDTDYIKDKEIESEIM